MQTVTLCFEGGPADGAEEQIKVRHADQPFDHRIKSTIADEAIREKNVANVSLYLFSGLSGNSDARVWKYKEVQRITLADYRAWKFNRRPLT